MQRTIQSVLLAAAIGAIPLVIATTAKAQITNQIDADIPHTFTVGDATLPAGRYALRMVGNSDLQTMTIQSKNGDYGAEFLVRQSDDSHTPRHTELIFNRYGHHEFLEKIYQNGSKIGIAVAEPSHEEARLQKQGQTPVTHTETGAGEDGGQ